MFEFGKKEGMLGIAALVLAVVPFVMVMAFWPGLGDQVPMKVNVAGEVLRWGAKWELLAVPLLGFLLAGATIATGRKQAKGYRDDALMAQITFSRSMRNAIVQDVVFVVATAFILYGAVSGHGIGF